MPLTCHLLFPNRLPHETLPDLWRNSEQAREFAVTSQAQKDAPNLFCTRRECNRFYFCDRFGGGGSSSKQRWWWSRNAKQLLSSVMVFCLSRPVWLRLFCIPRGLGFRVSGRSRAFSPSSSSSQADVQRESLKENRGAKPLASVSLSPNRYFVFQGYKFLNLAWIHRRILMCLVYEVLWFGVVERSVIISMKFLSELHRRRIYINCGLFLPTCLQWTCVQWTWLHWWMV